MKKMLAVWILLCFCLTGCVPISAPEQTQPRFVVRITADYRSGVIQLHRQYTDSEKMRAVLNYLRCIDPYGTADTVPDAPNGSQAQIVLTYSDGSTKTYDQREDLYLREGSGVWRNIRADKGRELGLLLGLMESDEN